MQLTTTIGNYINVSETPTARENTKTRARASILVRGKPRDKILFTLDPSTIGGIC